MVLVMPTGHGGSYAKQFFSIYFTYDIQDREFTFNTAFPKITNLPHPPKKNPTFIRLGTKN